MYKAKFINSKEQVFEFGYEHGNIFDISNLTGQEVVVLTSQGFNQIGETVESLSVGSRSFEIKGRLLGDATQQKKEMLAVFAPFESGQLIFEEKYSIDCVVKYSPLITVEKKNPRFELVLSAPYPYWKKIREESYITGKYEPKFKFPVNFAEPHAFGISTTGGFINVFNGGEVEAPFKIEIHSNGGTVNPGIINVKTQEFIKLNTTLVVGEKYSIYRNANGRLVVEKEANGIVEDAFSALDEDSNLFLLHTGDNVFSVTADANERLITAVITFNDAVVGVYEGI